MNSPILETRALSIGYKGKATKTLFSDLNLTLEKGTLTCLMGPNGSGKSTLLRTLTGLQTALSGSISYSGNEDLLKDSRARAKAFSVVLTERLPVGYLSVWQVVALGRYPHSNWFGKLSDEDVSKVEWAIKAVHAEDLANRQIHTLSDGERQRVMIGRALAQETPVVFLDEPTAFLDLPHRIEIMHILSELSRACGLTLLLTTHDLELVLQSANHLWLMCENGTFCKGSPEDLLLNGNIERVFSRADLLFDKTKGSFQAKRSYSRFARLTGDSVGRRWTQSALEKIGIGVDDNEGGVVIEVICGEDDDYLWNVRQSGGSETYYTIDNLIRGLKNER